MSDETEPEPPEQGPPIDPQVPEPRGLSTYIQLLGEWSRGTVSEPFLLGLIRTQGFGPAEKTEFLAGAGALWGLVPPIEAPDIAEAELEPEAARALGLAVALRCAHALHHHLPSAEHPTPRVLRATAEIITVLQLVLEGAEEVASPAERRLRTLQEELGERNVDTSRLADRKEDVREAVVARRRQEAEAEKERWAKHEEQQLQSARPKAASTGVPLRYLVGALAALVVSAYVGTLITPKPSGGLPPASAYEEVPVLGIIRHPNSVYVRVKPEWAATAATERTAGALALWARLNKESGGAAERIVLQTQLGADLAVVNSAGITWLGALAAPAPLTAESGQSPASRDP